MTIRNWSDCRQMRSRSFSSSMDETLSRRNCCHLMSSSQFKCFRLAADFLMDDFRRYPPTNEHHAHATATFSWLPLQVEGCLLIRPTADRGENCLKSR